MNMQNIHRSLTIILLMLIFLPLQAKESVFDQQPAYSKGYDPTRNAFDDGRAALKLAKETNRRVLIEVGGDWCMFCHILDRFIKSNPVIEKALYETFVVLKVNYSEDNKNVEFLSNFGRIPGYPHLFITENTGKVIYSNDIRDMTVKGKLSKTRMFEFIQRWKIQNSKL